MGTGNRTNLFQWHAYLYAWSPSGFLRHTKSPISYISNSSGSTDVKRISRGRFSAKKRRTSKSIFALHFNLRTCFVFLFYMTLNYSLCFNYAKFCLYCFRFLAWIEKLYVFETNIVVNCYNTVVRERKVDTIFVITNNFCGSPTRTLLPWLFKIFLNFFKEVFDYSSNINITRGGCLQNVVHNILLKTNMDF